MNLQITLLRTYFGIYSTLAPKLAAGKSFKVFQKVRKKDIRPREQAFFRTAKHAQFNSSVGLIDFYSLGNTANPTVFLVHGWDSNAGSMAKLAEEFVANNQYVVLMNLPGHAFSSSSSTNLLECGIAFQELLGHLKLKDEFSVVSHSFGSAVVSYALSKSDIKVNRLIFLTNPNRVERIYDDFRKMIGLRKKAFNELIRLTENKLGESIEEISVVNKLKGVNYAKLILIHDEHDQVLNYINSIEVKEAFPEATLIPFEKIGHYKMLWNDEVIKVCIEELA